METWQKQLSVFQNICALQSEVKEMSDERKYIDYATVRDALLDAQERRGELSYEQDMALNHASWAASTRRNGIETDTKVFNDLLAALLELDKLEAAPDIAAKIAEIIPIQAQDVKAILASKRVVMDDNEVEHIVTLVRQHVGYEG
jgi:DNA-directed RNA polymerase subunit F